MGDGDKPSGTKKHTRFAYVFKKSGSEIGS